MPTRRRSRSSAALGPRSGWTDFLRDPQAMVPGTSMVFPGVADDRLRAELVDYLIATSKVGGQ